MIGETVGNYRVTGKLGEGGMGAVYVAEHTSLGRRVAIKVLLPDASKRPDLVDRFFNEAKTLANLRHPALVEVYDYGLRENGSAYLVMDHLEGETLAARLERRHKLPVAEALELARQIAGGLIAAHAHGIVHRDLKPDNVFVVRDPEDPTRERVKILDFGIAKLVQPGGGSKGATQTGMVLGTPLYMAPEQCRGSGAVDHRADVYSLGCILYAMLTGQPPFPYEGVGEILGAHLYEPPKPPRTLDPSIPEALDALVCKALAKKPEERYASMSEIAQALVAVGARSTTGASLGAPVAPELARAATMIAGGAVPVPDPVAVKTPVTAADRPAVAATATTLGGAVGVGPASTAPERRGRGLAIGLGAAGLLAAVALVAVVARGKSKPATVVAAAPAPAPVTAKPVPAAPPAQPAAAPTPAEPKPARPAEPAASRPRARSSAGSSNAELYARGLVLLEQGDEARALEALRSYLGGSGQSPSTKADAERRVIALQRRVGEIEILCDVDGATVIVDGVVRGHTPVVKSVVLPPGAHTLEVTRAGYQTVRRPFTIGPGQRQPFRFSLPR